MSHSRSVCVEAIHASTTNVHYRVWTEFNFSRAEAACFRFGLRHFAMIHQAL